MRCLQSLSLNNSLAFSSLPRSSNCSCGPMTVMGYWAHKTQSIGRLVLCLGDSRKIIAPCLCDDEVKAKRGGRQREGRVCKSQSVSAYANFVHVWQLSLVRQTAIRIGFKLCDWKSINSIIIDQISCCCCYMNGLLFWFHFKGLRRRRLHFVEEIKISSPPLGV